MRFDIKRFAELLGLTDSPSDAIGADVRLLADNGTANGTVTAGQVAALAAPLGHTHPQSEIDDLPAALAGKMDVGAASGFADASAFAADHYRLAQAVDPGQLALRSAFAPSHQIPHAMGYFAFYAIPHGTPGEQGQYGCEIYVSNRNGDRVLLATLPPF